MIWPSPGCLRAIPQKRWRSIEIRIVSSPRAFSASKTAIWALEREASGTFPKGTYNAYESLEWADAAKKKERIERLSTNAPAFAPIWKEKAFLTEDTKEKLVYL